METAEDRYAADLHQIAIDIEQAINSRGGLGYSLADIDLETLRGAASLLAAHAENNRRVRTAMTQFGLGA